MRPSYACLCSVSIFNFRETGQTFLQCFSHHQLVNGFDCWQLVVNASQISQSYFALRGQRLIHWLWLSRQSLFSSRAAAPVSRVSRLRRSRARALLSPSLKKKRGCSQSTPVTFFKFLIFEEQLTHKHPQYHSGLSRSCRWTKIGD